VAQALGMTQETRWEKDEAGIEAKMSSDLRIIHIMLW
jgi:hypothetical protein